MAQTVNVNGVSISYPETGDTGWGDEATDFAVQTSSALSKLGLSTGTTVDIPGTLDVLGSTDLNGSLDVALQAIFASTVTIVDDLAVDTDTLFVDTLTDRVGINKSNPTVDLDVNGNAAISGTLTAGTFAPTNLAVDTNVLLVDGSTNRVGINNSAPSTDLDVIGNIKQSGQILSADGNVSSPAITFSSDTNTGIFRSASDQIDLVTGGGSRFRIEPTGQIKAVYESQIGTDYNTQLGNGYLCRGWVNFDGTGNGTFAGGASTVSRASGSTTATVTTTNPHGLITGNTVYANSGVVAGSYTVTVTGTNTFTITTGATTVLSAVSITFLVNTIRASGNVSSITDNGTGNYTVNFANALPDANYNTIATVEGWVTTATQINNSSCLIKPYNTGTGVAIDQTNISVAVFR